MKRGQRGSKGDTFCYNHEDGAFARAKEGQHHHGRRLGLQRGEVQAMTVAGRKSSKNQK